MAVYEASALSEGALTNILRPLLGRDSHEGDESDMADAVVTIARSMGAGGEDVGYRVAEALAFRHVDEEIIARAAEKSGATPERVMQAEQRQSLMARLLESISATE